jgi:hypothetical protein
MMAERPLSAYGDLGPPIGPRCNALDPARPRRLRVSLFTPKADEPASTAAQRDSVNILKVRHFLNPSRFR